jgi:hypothetical protein
VNIASFDFFLFWVRLYSVDFAIAGGRKLLVSGTFVRPGGDMLSEYGPGDGAEFIASEALFGPRLPTN